MDDHLKEIKVDGELAYDGNFLKVSRDRVKLPMARSRNANSSAIPAPS